MNAEVVTRRNLPHWYKPGAAHFVTFRLAGAIPVSVIRELQTEKESQLRQGPAEGESPGDCRLRIHKQLFAKYDDYLDLNREIGDLADPKVAAQVRSSLHHFDGERYGLMAYCIMPNHVHVLLVPFVGVGTMITEFELGETNDTRSPLSGIMHSLKGYTAHKANEILRRKGQFWQHESYDHWVRDEEELERIVAYIAFNPVKANLAKLAHEWYWSSAHHRFLLDGELTGWLPPVVQASPLAQTIH